MGCVFMKGKMKKSLIFLIVCLFTKFIYSEPYRAIDNNIENISIEEVLKEKSAYSDDIQLKLVKLAYENGASLSGSSSTALIEAVRMNKYSIVEYLLSLDDGKELIDVKHNMFARPLFYAFIMAMRKLQNYC